MNAAYEQLLEAPSPSFSPSLDTSKSFKTVEIEKWMLSFVFKLLRRLFTFTALPEQVLPTHLY